ncbi:hypothetical protein HDU89_002793 [Geranomyces variabilis]|nr:hypothetical protein HDU89_002793 [Geranomyces variabilis]
MAPLRQGNPLPWSKAQMHAGLIRARAVQEILALDASELAHGRNQKYPFLWGDEVEHMVLITNGCADTDGEERVVLGLGAAPDLLERLRNDEQDGADRGSWHEEYASYMVESTPSKPYEWSLRGLADVQDNMERRRRFLCSVLPPNQTAITLTNFLTLGCTFAFPLRTPSSPSPLSLCYPSAFLPDAGTSCHPRFQMLGHNGPARRKGAPPSAARVFRDVATPTPFFDDEGCLALRSLGIDELDASHPIPSLLYMDSPLFGMGCCCLQLTFQAPDADAARALYDQFVPLAPVLIALAAGSPCFRGWLVDTDARWGVLQQVNDDRTPGERGLVRSKLETRIPRSRYSSPGTYASKETPAAYGDVEVAIDRKVLAQLVEQGVDVSLAKHYASQLVRDPLVVFDDVVCAGSRPGSCPHLENFISSNWNTVRLKPPSSFPTADRDGLQPPPVPGCPDIGWRVEFRPMDIQLTDKENAALSVFVALLARAILQSLHGGSGALLPDLTQPLSAVDDNMLRAQEMDAVTTSRLRFSTLRRAGEWEEQSIQDIICGRGDCHDGGGLLGVAERVVESFPKQDRAASEQIRGLLKLLRLRAEGTIPTNAQYIRSFVRGHADYKGDSKVSAKICSDLVGRIKLLAQNDQEER